MSSDSLDPQKQIQMILKLIAWLQDQVGKNIQIVEDLSFDYASNRFAEHCTLHQIFQFVLQDARAHSSGGHLYLSGESAKYGIGTEVQELAIEAQKVVVLQALSHDVWRQTQITVLES